MTTLSNPLAALLSLFLLAACQQTFTSEAEAAPVSATKEVAMDVQYLEIVTEDVDATIATLASVHGVEFGESVPLLGNARVAELSNGARLGVRAPLSPDEGAPLVRPYLRVDDIEAAITAAQAAGAEFAMLATEIPGQGTFAIYFLGGIQYGLWEL